ncbi:MAG: outer membrane lipoprotein chaperone LolA [Woeseiaceae bacterium]|nr:outer membrane lipoprotein chaperone LolA [Woeseiaceae bacterium]
MVRTFPVWSGIALLLCGTADVQPAEAIDGEQLVRQFVEDVQTMSAAFEQTLVDADDAVLEESSGTLDIKRPGRFRWAYTEPYEQLLVADGRNVWSYDADLLQVTVKPQDDVLGSTPALLLGGGSNVLEDFRVVESFRDRGTAWVRLRPLADESSFDTVDLGFDANDRLDRMIFVDSLGQSTLIALQDPRINEPLADDLFTFVPPDGVDVVGTPLPAAPAGH